MDIKTRIRVRTLVFAFAMQKQIFGASDEEQSKLIKVPDVEHLASARTWSVTRTDAGEYHR